jgi:ubiquinone/menaquinone biosynthesis C-methylase UbiE
VNNSENKLRIELAFDSAAPKYDILNGPSVTETAKKLIEGLDPQEKPVVLDVGCGTGIATFELLKTTRGQGNFLGVDISQKMVDIANRQAAKFGIKNAQFTKGDGENLELKESSFDLVISNQALHWIKDQEKTLKCAYNALKPGGKIAVAFQGGPSFKELFEAYDRVKQSYQEFQLFDRPKSITLEDTEKIFLASGFHILDLFAIQRIVFLNPTIFFRNDNIQTAPWKIGLSTPEIEQLQKAIATELSKIKPQKTLQTTNYVIYGYGEK